MGGSEGQRAAEVCRREPQSMPFIAKRARCSERRRTHAAEVRRRGPTGVLWSGERTRCSAKQHSSEVRLWGSRGGIEGNIQRCWHPWCITESCADEICKHDPETIAGYGGIAAVTADHAAAARSPCVWCLVVSD